MTTIVWDGKQMVADTQGSYGDTKLKVVKAFKVNGMLLGGAGDCTDIMAFVTWVKSGMKLESFPTMPRDSMTVLVVSQDNGVVEVRRFESSPYPIAMTELCAAIGSGRGAALGAMAMGADAQQAMEIAKRFDVNTGGELTVLQF